MGNETTTPPATTGTTDKPETGKKAKLVTVQVGKQAINEDGAHYPPASKFQTTPERAAALGEFVSAVKD